MGSSRSKHKLERLGTVLCSGQRVSVPGFEHQGLAGAKAQISCEYSLCPRVEKLSSESCQDTLPFPPCSSDMGLPLSEHLPFSREGLSVVW